MGGCGGRRESDAAKLYCRGSRAKAGLCRLSPAALQDSPGHDFEGQLGRSGECSGEQFKAFGAGQSGIDASIEEPEAWFSDGNAIGSGTAFDDGEGADGEIFAE